MFEAFWKFRRRGACVLLAWIVLVAGCSPHSESGNDPQKVIQDYISRSFSVKSTSDREGMLALLTRDAKNRLSAWSDDQFRDAFIESKRQFVKLAFTESKSESSQEVSVTYELSYLDQAKGHDAKVTQKKLAQVIQESGRWYIADVKNIKELVEYRDSMTLP